MGHENETSHTFGAVMTTGAPDVSHKMGKGANIGNIPVTEATVFVSTDNVGPVAGVLAPGKPGQRIVIVLTKIITVGGVLNVSFTDYAGATKILAFTAAGSLAELIYIGPDTSPATGGWQSIVLNAVTVT